MRTIRLTVRYALCMAVLVIVIHALTPTTKLLGQSLLAQQSQSTPTASTPQARSAVPAITPLPEAKAGQGLSSDLEKIGTNVRPSVIWVTVFDSKGNLLRTESGFFISADGRIVTTAHAIEGAVNAVAKTGDGGIYNVSGVLAASKELDLAILEAEVKPRKLVRFLELNKDPDLPVGTSVVAVGSGLAVNEGSPKEMTIAAQKADHLELTGATPPSSVGCPLVNETGAVVGVVTSAGEKTAARSSTALESLSSRVAADTHARWLATAEASATPKPTPKPRIVYAPAPAFPPGVSQGGVAGTGRFRLSFDASGNATNVQVVRSTGNPYFDSAAIKTLRQWKSAPSQGWSATVPVTFQTR
jgi:TonB family protein